MDAADHAIVRHVRAGDLVVTADPRLASQIVATGAQALHPRGPLYSPANLSEYLTRRRVMDERRQSVVGTRGPMPASVRSGRPARV